MGDVLSDMRREEAGLMPYIPRERRKLFDILLDDLAAALVMAGQDRMDGELNYCITRLVKHLYPLNYRSINRAMGVLECVKAEFYRRVVVPYEDIKLKENGDV